MLVFTGFLKKSKREIQKHDLYDKGTHWTSTPSQ